MRFQQGDHVVDYVDDYLHEVLDPAEHVYVQQHVETCRICQVALAEGQTRMAALQAVPMLEAPQALVDQTLSNITQARRREQTWPGWIRRRPRAVLAAAAMIGLLAIGATHLYYANLRPSVYDLRVMGQRRMLADTTGSMRVLLMDTRDDRPIEGAKVDIRLRDGHNRRSVQLASFTTDACGTGAPRFHLPDWQDGDYQLEVVAQNGWNTETIHQTIALRRSFRLMLSTDKPVYQPGQVIHMRSLSLRKPDLKPLSAQQATFLVTDPKGNTILKEQVATSAYGIASADCALADEILEGPYTIACKIGDTESRQTVDVKKYVLPKFKVSVTLDKPYYQPAQMVRGTIQADYFFGEPVVSGNVEVELLSAAPPQTTLRKATVRTDEKGRAEFQLRLPEALVGKPQDSGDARLLVRATLKDSAGQEQTRAVPCTVTNRPLRIEVFSETGSILPSVNNKICVLATYADGRPAKVQLAVASDPATLSVNVSPQTLATNEAGLAWFTVTPEGQVRLNVTVRATEAHGLTASRTVDLSTSDPWGVLIVQTDKAVYSGGETVHATVAAYSREPVFLDFVKDGQTLLTQAVDVSKDQGHVQFDLPADLSGTLQLCAYRFDSQGFAVRKTRTIYVRQAKQIKVEAATDSAEYRPGGKARLTLTLTDADGQPTPGAISLAAVGEAVFNVMQQAPGMERTFFALDDELLKPVYEICPWSPDATLNVPAQQRSEFEKALFLRTLKDTWSDNEQVKKAMAERARAYGYADSRRWSVEGADNQEMLERGDPQLAGLLSARGPHTLSLTTYETNAQRVYQQRHQAMDKVYMTWFFAGVPLGLVLLFAVFGRKILTVVIAIVIGLFLISILLPSLGKAREMAGRSAFKASNLAQPVAPRAPRPPEVVFELAEQSVTDLPTATEALAGPSRIREWFPETLLWKPELITDDNGQVSIEVDLADSITTWRLTAGAVTADGRLGGTESPIRVFQPFFVDLNLPVALTRGDEVSIPVVVYNYLDKPQTVRLDLQTAADSDADKPAWFELLDEASKQIELVPGEVRSTSFRIRANKVGQQDLMVTARSGQVADAIKRSIEVVPDGRRVEQVVSGILPPRSPIDLNLPEGIIEGSAKAIVKIYPSSFSQLVEGLDAIFQRPSGCFEQTSSTTYPNVLALDYLKRTNQAMPQVEAKARQYVHLGYQRLLGFEVKGGGFDWFGRAPANTTLTAYGLMEFEDMAKVHDVDQVLIDRTRNWLLSKRNADGSWSAEGHGMHDDPTRRGSDAQLANTAYIAWAVFRNGAAAEEADATQRYLQRISATSIDNAYTLALLCNALLALDDSGHLALPYLARLQQIKQYGQDGQRCWWSTAGNARTAFYGAGQAGQIETTALAALAMIQAHQDPSTVRGALTWLIEQKDARGTWHSTQATVLALKAILAGTGQPLGESRERRTQVTLDGKAVQQIVIPAEQAEVMKQFDLTPFLKAGHQQLDLADLASSGAGYQVMLRYHVPAGKHEAAAGPLSIDIRYSRDDLAVGESLAATATVTNHMPQPAPMVIVDLPIPPGFAIDADDLAAMKNKGLLEKYQLTPRSAIVYLRSLSSGKPLELRYKLQATMPVKVTAPGGKVYEYYDPAKTSQSPPRQLIVRAKGKAATAS